MKARLATLIGLASAGAVGAWALGRSTTSPAEPQAVASFAPVRELLRTFRTAYLDVSLDGRHYVMQTSGEGRLALDPHEEAGNRVRARYVWDDRRWTTIRPARGDETCPGIQRIPAPPELQQVWDELRSGFAGSVVTATTPSRIGFDEPWVSDPSLDTVMIRLPFAWATGLRWFVAYDPAGVRLVRMTLLDAAGGHVVGPLGPDVSPTFDLRVQPSAQRWDVPLDPGIFFARWGAVYSGVGSGDIPHTVRRLAEPRRPYEKCEAADGHLHGEHVLQEHTPEQLHGAVPPVDDPVFGIRYDPSCPVPP